MTAPMSQRHMELCSAQTHSQDLGCGLEYRISFFAFSSSATSTSQDPFFLLPLPLASALKTLPISPGQTQTGSSPCSAKTPWELELNRQLNNGHTYQTEEHVPQVSPAGICLSTVHARCIHHLHKETLINVEILQQEGEVWKETGGCGSGFFGPERF